MSLRDDLDKIANQNKAKVAQMLSDEEVYQILVRSMYNDCIVNEIKKGIAKGQSQFHGKFQMNYSTDLNDVLKWDRLLPSTSVYSRVAGYDEPDSIMFQKMYIIKTGVFRATLEMTPLGNRVYTDLKRFAKADNVSLSELIPEVTGSGTRYATGIMWVEFSYRYI